MLRHMNDETMLTTLKTMTTSRTVSCNQNISSTPALAPPGKRGRQQSRVVNSKKNRDDIIDHSNSICARIACLLCIRENITSHVR